MEQDAAGWGGRKGHKGSIVLFLIRFIYRHILPVVAVICVFCNGITPAHHALTDHRLDLHFRRTTLCLPLRFLLLQSPPPLPPPLLRSPASRPCGWRERVVEQREIVEGELSKAPVRNEQPERKNRKDNDQTREPQSTKPQPCHESLDREDERAGPLRDHPWQAGVAAYSVEAARAGVAE